MNSSAFDTFMTPHRVPHLNFLQSEHTSLPALIFYSLPAPAPHAALAIPSLPQQHLGLQSLGQEKSVSPWGSAALPCKDSQLRERSQQDTFLHPYSKCVLLGRSTRQKACSLTGASKKDTRRVFSLKARELALGLWRPHFWAQQPPPTNTSLVTDSSISRSIGRNFNYVGSFYFTCKFQNISEICEKA